VRVDGKADLSQINPDWLDQLKEFLDASAKVQVVPEITLFNPWGACEYWDAHWWNPKNNVQGHAEDPASLYTLGNPCQPFQEQWTPAILKSCEFRFRRKIPCPTLPLYRRLIFS